MSNELRSLLLGLAAYKASQFLKTAASYGNSGQLIAARAYRLRWSKQMSLIKRLRATTPLVLGGAA